jgi:hypothetical protein
METWPSVTVAGEGLQNVGLAMLGAQGLWAGRDLYRATPAVTGDLGFFSVSSEGPLQSVASYDKRGGVEDLF